VKIANNETRKKIALEESNASQFKFTKMTRKPAYKPLVHNEGVFTATFKITEVHGKAMDGRDREALIFPDKVKDHSKKWQFQRSEADYLKKEAGREIDKFDDIKSKYFISTGRGLGTVANFVRTVQRAQSVSNTLRYYNHPQSSSAQS
jgi:hypothetical protein